MFQKFGFLFNGGLLPFKRAVCVIGLLLLGARAEAGDNCLVPYDFLEEYMCSDRELEDLADRMIELIPRRGSPEFDQHRAWYRQFEAACRVYLTYSRACVEDGLRQRIGLYSQE